MKINVVYTTQIKAALGKTGEVLNVPEGGTLPQLVEQLAGAHGDKFRDVALTDAGELLSSILLCVGDEQINRDDARLLEEGDTVTLLSAISGG